MLPFSGNKSVALKCNFCGFSHCQDFIKISDNLYECPACSRPIDLGFSHEEDGLLAAAHDELKRQEFDVAEEKYRSIVERFPKNHEAYWGLVCAKYGIKYEEDFDGNWKPTYCLDVISTFDDDIDYIKALECAPPNVQKWYREQAEYVKKISEKWANEASKEKPCDIFICFKDSDTQSGERTKDSYDAAELYAWLVNEGYKVFFSRVSLAGKIGEKYEPYIFHALKTAKVMLVFGSKEEYINSTWMKNEWQRFGKGIERGEKSSNSIVLINNGMNISALPRVFRSNQCLNYDSRSFYLELSKYLQAFFGKLHPTESSVPKVTPIKAFNDSHKHEYKMTGIIPPSCISEGYTLYECACGEKYKENFTPKVDHAYDLVSSTPATCTDGGQNVYICAACGEKNIKNVPALGHNYGAWQEQIAATCECEGQEARRCLRCGYIEQRIVPKKPHSFTPWENSRDGKGSMRYCKSCGKEEHRALVAYQPSAMKDFVIVNGLLKAYVGKGGNVVIPDEVVTIGNAAFRGCRSLTGIACTAESQLTTIGCKAFADCAGLKKVEIPKSVAIIEDSAFEKCEKLTEVIFEENCVLVNIGAQAFADCGKLASIELPNHVEAIKDFAFGNCGTLKSVQITSDVRIISNNAFSGCIGLESMVVAAEGTKYRAYGNCLIDIGNKTLIQGCGNGVIPDDGSVTRIGAYAFRGNESLSYIDIPLSVNWIEGGAFESCSNLTQITLPSHLVTIGDRAFFGCGKLAEVIVPASVTYIGSNAFGSCIKLKSLVFESPCNWSKSWQGGDGISMPAGALSNSGVNAGNFSSSFAYMGYSWRKNDR